MNMFFHGQVPGKNTMTRVHLRRDATKPRRSADSDWPEKPAQRFEGQITSDTFPSSRSPKKSFDFPGTPLFG